MSSTTLVESSSIATSSQIEERKTISTAGISFQELDTALKQVAKEETAESMSVEITLPSKSRRARSLSRNNTETLPDEVSILSK